MFRLQDNVPDNYIKESRDFQLLCRLYDVVNNGVRYDIKSMADLLDANTCQDAVLDLLATRKGFFTNKTFNTKLYRALLDGFPYIQKYKGSKLGVEMAVSLILRLDGLLDSAEISIDNESNNVTITTNYEVINKLALDELMRYILPIGMTYTLSVTTQSLPEYGSQVEFGNFVKFYKGSSMDTSGVSDLSNFAIDGSNSDYKPSIMTTTTKALSESDSSDTSISGVDGDFNYTYRNTSDTITTVNIKTPSLSDELQSARFDKGINRGEVVSLIDKEYDKDE